jgi:amino acid transporter
LDKKRTVFAREATGLVREAGVLDVVQFNAVSLTGVSIVSGTTLILPIITSGPSVWESIIVGFVLAMFVNFTYYVLSVTIPRSGGDYVYISRLLHPSLGVLSAGLTGIFGALVLSATFGATVWVTSGVAPLLTILGQGQLATALSNATLQTGIFTTILFAALLIFGGTKAFYRLNNVVYAIATIGLIVGGASFLLVGHDGFIRLFDAFAKSYGTSSSDIVSTANSFGFTIPASGAWPMIVASAGLFTSFYWSTQSAYLGGEIKHIKQTHMWGIFGATVLWFLVTLFCITAAYYTVGPELLSASSYLNYFQAASWKLPALSFYALWATIAANNLPAGILICLAFVFGYITVTGWSFIIFSRAVFALAFDRFFPTPFADISERFHTPVKAIILYAILNIIVLVLLTVPAASVTIYLYAVGLNVVYMLAFFLGSLSLIVLPYRGKAMFDVSCPIRQRVAGIPVISIIGVISAALLVFYEYVYLVNTTYYGVTSSFLEVMVGFVIFFLALYFVIAAIRKSRGIDLGMVYKQIPPE